MPVLDLSLLLEKRNTRPRISSRFVVLENSEGVAYAALCEQVTEIIAISDDVTGVESEMVECGGELCRVWDPLAVKVRQLRYLSSENLR
jgi:hypothetical protein